jgi:hypothetical protein
VARIRDKCRLRARCAFVSLRCFDPRSLTLNGFRVGLERLRVVGGIGVQALFVTVQQLTEHVDVGDVWRR